MSDNNQAQQNLQNESSSLPFIAYLFVFISGGVVGRDYATALEIDQVAGAGIGGTLSLISIKILQHIYRVVSKLAAGYRTVLFDGPADPVTPGMKQRITIGRVLVNRPRILLFDHADKSLDKEGYNHVFRLLGQLKGQASMVLVSNDRNILHLAQEEYMISDGALVSVDDETVSKSGDVIRPFKELRL